MEKLNAKHPKLQFQRLYNIYLQFHAIYFRLYRYPFKLSYKIIFFSKTFLNFLKSLTAYLTRDPYEVLHALRNIWNSGNWHKKFFGSKTNLDSFHTCRQLFVYEKQV